MPLEVSLIIPIHNQTPLFTLTLESLRRQTFAPHSWELVVVDDGSTEPVEAPVKAAKLPQTVKLVRLDSNKGRAAARNAGIEAAAGRMVIFLDSDMIAGPNLVEEHWRRQRQADPATVVSGAMNWWRLYSHAFPQFSNHHKALLLQLARRQPRFRRRIPYGWATGGKPTQIVYPGDLKDGSFQVMALQVPGHEVYTEVIARHGSGLQGFQLPWISFITNNVSVERARLLDAGGFDEKFKAFGLEDWELGYRLYQRGASFVHNGAARAWHQEHPRSTDRPQEELGNYRLFIERHPSPDVRLLAFFLWGSWSLLRLSNLLQQRQSIEALPEIGLIGKAFDDLLAAQIDFLIWHGRLPQARRSPAEPMAGWSPQRWQSLYDQIDFMHHNEPYIKTTLGHGLRALRDALLEWMHTTPRVSEGSADLPGVAGRERSRRRPSRRARRLSRRHIRSRRTRRSRR